MRPIASLTISGRAKRITSTHIGMAKNVGRLRTKQTVLAASRGEAEKVVQQAEILQVEFRIEGANE